MRNKIEDILTAWKQGKNALLYGPPATGKTRLISELFDILNSPPEDKQGILLDPNTHVQPFTRPTLELPIPKPVKVVWTTFHQSYGYEDFVLCLRPEMGSQGTRLQPFAGVFLDAALELRDPKSEYESVVIFIDEINRGNAARIFGEFMTFLDFDYREKGRVPLPVPLRQLAFSNGKSEKIRRLNGSEVEINENFHFPKDIYIVATMNSVDRAAVPIDSALSRRFNRIEMRPDLDVLAELWDLNSISIPTDENWNTLPPLMTAYLVLDRLNISIASDIGPEFELGHGLLTSLATEPKDNATGELSLLEKKLWKNLADVWDDVIFPQLEDRFSGRPEQLLDLLRVDSPPPNGEYAWNLRKAQGGVVAARTLNLVRVSELSIDVIKRSFRWITR